MAEVDRRGFLNRAAAVGGVAAVSAAGLAPAGSAAGAGATAPRDNPSLGPVTIGPDDPRYADLRVKGVNGRFTAEPDRFVLVGSTEQVVDAVRAAVRAGRRITVRGGGHSCETLVVHGAEVIIDLSEFHDIAFDRRRNAFVVEAGATLREVFKTLYYGWGVTIPGGQCGEVGVGGHFAGGGYGPQSRLFGSVVDYLYAVEVVVVDAGGRVRAVVATREDDDPNRDLWWAHTGAGGGNFGVVTRYWLRDPKATGSDPAKLLPKPPGEILSSMQIWSWGSVDQASFARILRNYGGFHEKHSGPDTEWPDLFSVLLAPRKTAGADPGGFVVATMLDGTQPDAEGKLARYQAAIARGAPPPVSVLPATREPWLKSALNSGTNGESGKFKQKSAYLRKRFTDEQAGVAYKHLTESVAEVAGLPPMLWLLSYGGRVNAVRPNATVMPQRDSILKAIFLTGWDTDAEEAAETKRVREFYREMYAGTGGVPVPNDRNDGCYINYPDVDMADEEWNTSGVPWHRLYFKDNYPRLQRIKAKWDPGNVFHHALSIRP